jgi:hypothetical protein
MDHPREMLTKLRSGKITFCLCPACLARRRSLKIAPFEKKHEVPRARQALSVD